MIRVILTLILALTFAACDDSPTSNGSSTVSTVAGTVVFDPSGTPASGVDVVLQRCSRAMMGQRQWDPIASMKTDTRGHFHFEYHHTSMHQYRVGVPGTPGWHPCDGYSNDDVTLRIPSNP